MSPELTNILQDVIKTINHIKVHALNSHLFLLLAEHTCLLLYREVTCLSKARCLARIFELKKKLQSFLLEKNQHWQYISVTQNGSQNIQPAQQTQSVTSWKMTTVFQSTNKVAAFKAKLEV